MRLFPVKLLALSLTGASLWGSYHFVRYSNRWGYQQPIYEKFDLNALVNRTVPFFIVTDGREKLAAGDNANALMSQILLAARTWSDVSTSELRLTFGGYASEAAGAQGGPGIDIIFSEDVPPGVISYAGPTVKADADLNAEAPFTPILRSLVVFRKDLTNIDGVAYPSYSENFFLNAVHELGHALGLQHTFTSSAMSIQRIRATTRSKPLAADDIAGISILYPAPNFAALFGEISGRVTADGQGVNLASVVAISLNGTAVSTLTNPDGTYRIQGVPPGPYQIYVHPLPPPVAGHATPGDIILPRDPENNPIGVNNRFRLQFYPNSRDAQGGSTLNLAAGQKLTGIDFAVAARSEAPSLFYPTTYSYVRNEATGTGSYVRPAFITPQVRNPLFIASGYGFVTGDSQPVPGLRSSMLGGAPAVSGIRGFSNQFVIFDLFMSGFAGEGERHLFLDNGEDTMVLPSAIQVSNQRAPDVVNVNWISPASDGSGIAEITATGLQARTRVLVDGEPATIQSMDPSAGLIRIAAPPAPTGHVARVILLNPDGQSSLFNRPDAPAQLPYTEPASSVFTVRPAVLSPGTETVVEIRAPGSQLATGRVTVGFGSSDVQVRAVSVVSPERALVSVRVAPNAEEKVSTVTLRNGLQHWRLEAGMQVRRNVALAQAPLQPNSRWRNENGSEFVTPGSNAVLEVAGLTATNVRVQVNQQEARVISAGEGRVLLQVPATVTPGWALLEMTAEGETVNPVLVEVAGAAPTIQRLEGADQIAIDSNRPGRPGDSVTVTFRLDADVTVRANEVVFELGETPIYTIRVERIAPGTYQSLIALPRGVADGNYPLTLSVRGRKSAPMEIPLRNR